MIAQRRNNRKPGEYSKGQEAGIKPGKTLKTVNWARAGQEGACLSGKVNEQCVL